MSIDQRYFAGDVDPRTELGRLRLLESIFDAKTTEGLERIGVGEGWRCLEVGAGAGSIVRWLSQRVGRTGEVVAADLDPRFLSHIREPNVTVLELDILQDDLVPFTFDLVHCRHVLTHLTDGTEDAIVKMISALRPGGWLFVEEADSTTMQALTPGHLLNDAFERSRAAFIQAAPAERIFDPETGSKLPAMLARLGLHAIEAIGSNSIEFGGDTPVARWYTISAGLLAPLLVGKGYLDQTDADLRDAAFADPSFCYRTITMYRISGCRPLTGHSVRTPVRPRGPDR